MKQRFFKKKIKKLLKRGITLYADILVSNKKHYKYYVDFLIEPTPTLKRKSEFHTEWRQRQIKKIEKVMSKNEKKARELAARLVGEDQNQQPLIDLLVEMAEWKESELKGGRPRRTGGKTTIDLIQEFMTSLNLRPGDTDDIKDSAALVITARPTDIPKEREVKVYGMGDHKTLRDALVAVARSDRRVFGLFCEAVGENVRRLIKDKMFVNRILNDLDKMP